MEEPLRYMLDTNTASYLIKGKSDNLRKNLQAVPIHTVCISAITEAELLFGLAKKPKAKQLALAVNEFLLHVTVLPWDSDSAAVYATLRAKCESKGWSLGNMDMLIAAHAVDTLCILITNDKAFSKIKKFLTVVDWTKR